MPDDIQNSVEQGLGQLRSEQEKLSQRITEEFASIAEGESVLKNVLEILDEHHKQQLQQRSNLIIQLLHERYLEHRPFYQEAGERYHREAYLKKVVLQKLDQIFKALREQELKPSEVHRQLGSTILFSMDLNGLKAINDLSTHENGNLYLQRVAGALSSEKNPLYKLAGSQGLSVEFATGHGDEYFFLISPESDDTKPNSPPDPKTLRAWAQAVQNFVEETVKTGDLIDFSAPDTIRKLNGYSEQNWQRLPEEERQRLRDEVPPNYKLPATIALGIATLADGVGVAFIERDPENRGYDPKLSYQKNLERCMGAVFDVADKWCQTNKEEFKDALEASGDRLKILLRKILTRNRETLRLLRQLRQLQEQA